MTKNNNEKSEKDVLKEIAQNKEYKNKILQNLPNTLFKNACLCGLTTTEEQDNDKEKLEKLYGLFNHNNTNLDREKEDFTDTLLDNHNHLLRRDETELKKFLLENIYELLEKVNSKIFSEEDILTLVKDFFKIYTKKKSVNFLTPEEVIEYKVISSLNKRFLGYFCADFEKICLFDIKNRNVHPIKLLKNSIIINLHANNDLWEQTDKFDAIVAVNFPERIIRTEIEPFDDETEGGIPYDITAINFEECALVINELLSKLNDAKNLFCGFCCTLTQEEKMELKQLLTKNNISLKALIKSDYYSYLGENNEYGEEEDSLVSSQDLLLLERNVKAKGNQAYVLTNINNYVKNKELIKIIETIKKGVKKLTEKEETTITEIIDPSVDYIYDFDEIIRENYAFKLKQEQSRNGFIKFSGKALIRENGIKGFNEYRQYIDESQSFYIPINPRVFRLTGISTSISEIREKVFNSNLLVEDLAFDKIPWYKYICRDNKDYCENVFGRYPLKGYGDNLRNGIDVKEGNYGGDIVAAFLEVWRFSINQTENKLVISHEGFEQRLELGNETDKYNLIKNQIIQASCVQVSLNKDVLLLNFFKFLLENTESGKEFLREWKVRSGEGRVFSKPIDVFQYMKILLPTIDKQRLILQELSQIDRNQEVLKADKQAIIKYLDGKEKVFEITNPKNSDLFVNSSSSTYEFLPQSLASILYLDEYEHSEDYARKCKDLLLFFEATAQFHATVLLSAFCLNKGHEKKISGIIRNGIFKFADKKLEGEVNRYIEFRFTFGTWTTLLRQLLEDKRRSRESYKKDLHEILYSELVKAEDLFKNEKCLELLEGARILRNEEYGHTNNKTVEEDKELYLSLKNLANQISGCLVQIYNNVQFIYIKDMKGISEKDRLIYGGNAKGANARLRYIEIKAPDNSQLGLATERCQPYLKKGMGFKVGKDSLLPVVPLIKYGDLSDSDDMLKSTYFASSGGVYLDNIKESWINWISYDLGRWPKRKESYETDFMTRHLIEWINYSLTAGIKNDTESPKS